MLLRRGAASVVAVDVGYGQLAWKRKPIPASRFMIARTSYSRSRVRRSAPELVVGDMSFISLTLVLPARRRSSARR